MPQTTERLQAAHDFVAALYGDAAALDRLRAPESEGGYGCDWLMRQLPRERLRADEWRDLLSDPDRLREALDNLEDADDFDRREVAALTATEAAEDAAMDAACSDYAEVRDYEEGDEPGRYYAP